MENQHNKIKGYRELSQDEIDLMNRVEDHAETTNELIDELRALRAKQSKLICDAYVSPKNVNLTEAELDDLVKSKLVLNEIQVTESKRCISLAKDHLQTGQMWLVRAVALPESF